MSGIFRGHSFVLERPDGWKLADVELRDKQTLRLTLPAGDYPFYCPNRLLWLNSHREYGMTGVLHVR